MISWFRQLDDLLRGHKTGPQDLTQDRIEMPLRTFVPLAIILGAIYGAFMGGHAVFNRDPAAYMQLLASAIKLPALFLLTLVVTFPSLYVFNALLGCRLTLLAMLRLLVGVIVVNATVAASLGPILGFFTLSTTSYAFMVVFNVLLLALSGMVGLAFLLHSLRRIAIPPIAQPDTSDESSSDSDADEPQQPPCDPGPLEPISADVPDHAIGEARAIFRIWILLYGLVGAQMGWLLRPFIGHPDLPFTWFRERQGNFFLAVVHHLQILFTGN